MTLEDFKAQRHFVNPRPFSKEEEAKILLSEEQIDILDEFLAQSFDRESLVEQIRRSAIELHLLRKGSYPSITRIETADDAVAAVRHYAEISGAGSDECILPEGILGFVDKVI